MTDGGRSRSTNVALAASWIGAFALAFLVVRGTSGLLVVPGAAAGFLALVIALALAVELSIEAYDRFKARVPPQRLLWILPLVNLFGGYALIFAVIGAPSWSGRFDFWKDLVGIPPTPFTRLVTASFVVVGFSVGFLFVRLVARFLREPIGASLAPLDTVTTLACTVGLALIPAILIWGHLALPQNVHYLRGWIAVGMAHRPQEALEHFGRVVEAYPDSDLADSSLYRMARIEMEVLGRHADAEKKLERLIARYPRSPLVDDALLDLGDLALRTPSRPDRARGFLGRLLATFPRSYLRERAFVAMARALFESGRVADARALLEPLSRGEGRRLTVIEDAFGEVRVQRTVAMALEALSRMESRQGAPRAGT